MMYRLLLLVFAAMISFSVQTQGQSSEKPFFFNEFSLSLNNSNIIENNTGDYLGFGAGIYHSSQDQKLLGFMFGIEYNLTRQFVERSYEGRFAYATDLNYTLSYLSVPLSARLLFGGNTKFIFEAGGFLDLVLGSNRKGTLHSFNPFQHSTSLSEIDGGTGLSTGINWGFSLGTGIMLPLGDYQILIKPEYKYGFSKIESNRTELENGYLKLNIGLKI